MRNQTDALVPICIEKTNGRIAQIGTGVLIDFRGSIFLLTAGHVIDEQKHGGLMIPSGENIISGMDAVFSYYKPKNDRSEDMMDFGYIKLDHSYAIEVLKLFKPITESEIIITDNLSEYQIFSFSGFPYRKSRSWDGKMQTEMFSYGALLSTPKEYIEQGCNIRYHLIAKYDRKNSINAFSGEKQLPPLPHGISGGGVFAWPMKIEQIPPHDRRLIAIAHTYKEKIGCFFATNVNVFLKSILYNNPNLR